MVSTAMVADRQKDPGAALLFAGPAPLDADAVAREGLRLLESRQIFRVVPRWRGVLARASDLAPSVGLPVLSAMRRLGDRKQRD
ncbi:hypothetical protein [Tsukamurella paurometabola]|uniref:hypothetical protein n=1 Tax=Tsukamurella paurometabola TaxID=2061 RepID=UPI002015F2C3|nr:hypothetical protein [Tsukamurella paurometabola]